MLGESVEKTEPNMTHNSSPSNQSMDMSLVSLTANVCS